MTACTAAATATDAAALTDAIEALNTPQTAVTTIIVEAEDVEATDEDVEAGDATAGSATWTLSESDNGTPNVDADDVELGDGITAMFQVVAVNSTTPGRSIASNIAEGNTAAAAADPPDTAPAAPANLKLVGVGPASGDNNNVYLYWNRPAGLGETGVTVQVQRQYHRDTIGWQPINTAGGWVDVEHDTTADATNGLVGAGTDGNYSQHHDGGSAADIDSADTDSVRYRVRFVENQLTSEWVYSHPGGGGLSLPFPQETDHAYDSDGNDEVGAVSALPVIAGDNTATAGADEIEGLRPVNNMGHFHRIDLAWDRNNYCRVADGDDDDSLCDTTGQPSTYAVDVISGAAPGETDGADADWDFLTDTISASRTTYRHNSSSRDDATKLVSDETRYYRVFPWHAGRYGYPMVVTANTKLATVPGRIPNNGLRVTANGDEKLDLSWSQASNDGGSPVTGYIIQVSQDRDNNTALGAGIGWCDVAHQAVSDPPVATDRMYTYDGEVRTTEIPACASDTAGAPLTDDGEALAAGYGRWFRVIPLNKKSETALDADTSTAWDIDADSMNAIPAFGRTGAADPLAPGSAPGAPIGLVAETALNVHSELTTDKGVLLTWDVPADAGTLQGGIDAVITDYVVQVSVDGGEWTTLDDGVGATATDWTHSDPLPADTEERMYQVAAVNSVGQGSWSNMAYYTTTSMVGPTHMHVVAVTPNPLMAEMLTVGDMKAVDAAVGFTPDPAGVMVSYMAESDDDTVATAMADADGMVTIEAKAAGMATITVTATAAGDTATQTIMVTVNTAPMAEGMIDPVTVTAGMMSEAMDVSGYFSDADTDDTLTYTATVMPADGSIATADIPTGSSMLTITGVAAGMATVTVTATDAAGAMATQAIMVTVEAAAPMLTAPTKVMATSSSAGMVTVSWMPGDDAIGHLVMLFKSDFSDTPMVGTPSSNSHTFNDVPVGSYIAVVVSYRSASEYEYEALLSVVTVQ